MSDDGAMVRQGLFLEEGGACTSRYFDNVGVLCAPEAATIGLGPGVGWWWDSNSCDGAPLAYIPSDVCRTSPPTLGIELLDEGAPRLWELAPPWDQSVAWDSTSGECTRTDITDRPWTFFPATGLPNASMVPAMLPVLSDGDPVDFIWFDTPSGLRVEPGFSEGRFGLSAGGPFLLPDGRACSGIAAADGTIRCLSTEIERIDEVSASHYADPACTQRLEVVGMSELPPTELAFLQRNACGVTALGSEPKILADVRELGGPDTGTELYFRSSSSGSCQPAVRQPDLRYFAIGESILDVLPELSLE